jgi:hypothetical protein
MGVEKLAEAAIQVATTKGLGSMPRLIARLIAIGIIRATAALFDKNSVNAEVII